MAQGDTIEPERQMGRDAGKQPLPETENVMCPCCGQPTTKGQLRQYVDSLPTAGGMPQPGIQGPEADMGAPALDEGAIAGKYV